MCVCASGSRRTCRPARTVGAMTSVVSVTTDRIGRGPQKFTHLDHRYVLTDSGEREFLGWLSARGTLRLLADTRLLGLRERAPDVHEAAAFGALHLLAPRGVRCEDRTRRDEPADDDVLLQAA